MSGDQLVFLSVAIILVSCFANSVALNRKHGWKTGENYWLWGVAFSSTAYFAYGLSPHLGRLALTVANLVFVLSYVSLTFQLRFWRSGRTDTPRWVYGALLAYIALFEVSRDLFPYIVRASFAQGIIAALLAYLSWSAVERYQKSRSTHLLMISATFVVELLCVLSRLWMLWLLPETTAGTSSIYSEPFFMVVARWIWVVTNAMTYLAIMTYEMEKNLDRNEVLQALLKEKRQLLNAMSRVTRSHKAAGMASSLTHELRQPLSTILLTSQSLQAQLKDNNLQDLEAQIDFLCKECERSARLMGQLESVFRPRNLAAGSVSLSAMLDNVLLVLSPRLSLQGIAIKRLGVFDCDVRGETTQLESVLINLVSNAINALSTQASGGVIEIECAVRDKHCILEVRDNGPGIDPTILPNLGQLYLSGHEQGSGIGLWLSTVIVENHLGKLEAGNRDGGGAWVRVSLPKT